MHSFFTVALGQGQAPTATRLIEDGLREGNWVFLANCHLMTSWLPTLDKIIEAFETKQPHENFRLWLSSNPSPAFPIAILQRGLKMTTEPPKGLRANLLRLYNSVSEASYTQCRAQVKYQKLLFALTYFHSVLLERRKFRTLGFNIPYDFNDTDFSVSDDLLKSYLDSYEQTPWDALKYLIAGGRAGWKAAGPWPWHIWRQQLLGCAWRHQHTTVRLTGLSWVAACWPARQASYGAVRKLRNCPAGQDGRTWYSTRRPPKLACVPVH